jgi:hypothetical protein
LYAAPTLFFWIGGPPSSPSSVVEADSTAAPQDGQAWTDIGCAQARAKIRQIAANQFFMRFSPPSIVAIFWSAALFRRFLLFLDLIVKKRKRRTP